MIFSSYAHSYLLFISSAKIWICCSTVDGALEERPLWDRVLPANSKPTIWLHTANPIRTFRYLVFWEKETPQKKKRILCRENIPCLPMFVLVGGSTPFKPWKVQDQGSNLPVKFPFLVKSIILVAEFPYVCFYQTIFCQLNPMFFLSEIPFCWVKPCDAPRNPKVDLHSTSAASSHRRSPKSNEFPSG